MAILSRKCLVKTAVSLPQVVLTASMLQQIMMIIMVMMIMMMMMMMKLPAVEVVLEAAAQRPHLALPRPRPAPAALESSQLALVAEN